MQTVKLTNGVTMPILGLGTWNMDDAEAERAVGEALEIGYRHIDTAMMYQNEAGVGLAVNHSGIPREEIFVTTKLWPTDFDNPKAAMERSLERLGLAYVDLYLIHSPRPEMPPTLWRDMESIYKDESARAIGVSNFGVGELEPLIEASIPPMVNQLKCSPFDFNRTLFEYCLAKGIVFEAYSPLTRGKHLHDVVLLQLAEKYERTAAQIMLRWNIEHGMVTIPKSSDSARLRENFDIFNFSLEASDTALLDALSTH